MTVNQANQDQTVAASVAAAAAVQPPDTALPEGGQEALAAAASVNVTSDFAAMTLSDEANENSQNENVENDDEEHEWYEDEDEEGIIFKHIFLTVSLISAVQCTHVRFARFLSGGFITMTVIKSPEKKLPKRTSVNVVVVVHFVLRADADANNCHNNYFFFKMKFFYCSCRYNFSLPEK